ncbi:MAG TPA: bifunctional precorrin-2 dehydrogenase/sirohydrochlorin ferrochelatase [Thermoanaerobaculia bacterium]|nr:bifunctional precorrin-2 dehydrogenase/sirohydrochlorin ferrochelatase [Thermoanaerobaculia bacterium]
MADRTWAPLFFDLAGRRVVVVGGGSVAERKVRMLAAAGARVIIVAPEIAASIRTLASAGKVELREKRFAEEDLADVALAFAATADAEVNRAVAAAGRSRGIAVNLADQPDLCDFIVPATFERGPITVAFSTGGKSPALSRYLREALEEEIGPELGRMAGLLGALREPAKEAIPTDEGRADFFSAILRSPARELLASGEEEAALEAVRALCHAYGVPLPAKI